MLFLQKPKELILNKKEKSKRIEEINFFVYKRVSVHAKKTDIQLDMENKDRNKITEISLPFAFLKISANPLAAHCQAAHTDTQTKARQRATILLSHLFLINN